MSMKMRVRIVRQAYAQRDRRSKRTSRYSGTVNSFARRNVGSMKTAKKMRTKVAVHS
jgi:hypothetical protein